MKPANPFIAVLTALVVLAPGACGDDHCFPSENCFGPCETTDDCEDGEVCERLEGGEANALSCTLVCTDTADCGSYQRCRCGQGTASGFCDPWVSSPPTERVTDLCAADETTAYQCEELCACPCSFDDECPGGFTGEDCRTGCERAYDDFSGCVAELDAYYRCALRSAVCMEDTDGHVDVGCPNAWPYCWETRPADACPAESTALAACTSASWAFFYPTRE